MSSVSGCSLAQLVLSAPQLPGQSSGILEPPTGSADLRIPRRIPWEQGRQKSGFIRIRRTRAPPALRRRRWHFVLM
ncbi:MAG: hypothetical protein ABSE48_13390 [Verrucomicrobiota bacterium]